MAWNSHPTIDARTQGPAPAEGQIGVLDILALMAVFAGILNITLHMAGQWM